MVQHFFAVHFLSEWSDVDAVTCRGHEKDHVQTYVNRVIAMILEVLGRGNTMRLWETQSKGSTRGTSTPDFLLYARAAQGADVSSKEEKAKEKEKEKEKKGMEEKQKKKKEKEKGKEKKGKEKEKEKKRKEKEKATGEGKKKAEEMLDVEDEENEKRKKKSRGRRMNKALRNVKPPEEPEGRPEKGILLWGETMSQLPVRGMHRPSVDAVIGSVRVSADCFGGDERERQQLFVWDDEPKTTDESKQTTKKVVNEKGKEKVETEKGTETGKEKERKGEQLQPVQKRKPRVEFEFPGTSSAASVEFWRLLIQLRNAVVRGAKRENFPTGSNDSNAIWALAISHMRAYAIRIRTDDRYYCLQPGLFTIYKSMEFGPATDQPARNWMELAQFIKFVHLEQKRFEFKAGDAEARDEPFRDAAEEGVLTEAKGAGDEHKEAAKTDGAK
jgi:hypothetical protein